jgi:hypothetical protein
MPSCSHRSDDTNTLIRPALGRAGFNVRHFAASGRVIRRGSADHSARVEGLLIMRDLGRVLA